MGVGINVLGGLHSSAGIQWGRNQVEKKSRRAQALENWLGVIRDSEGGKEKKQRVVTNANTYENKQSRVSENKQ